MAAGIKFNIDSATPKTFFKILVIACWTHWTILRYIITIIKRLPVIGAFGSWVMPVLFVTLIVISMPYILQRIKIKDFFVYLLMVLIVVSTLLFYPDNSEYIFPYLWKILGTCVPLYFVGVAYDHEELKKTLYWSSLIGVFVTFLYQIYSLSSGRVLETDNMSASYNLLPSIIYLIFWAVDNTGVKNWILAVAGGMVSLVFGTRGPIIIILLLMSVCLVYKTLKLKNAVVKVFAILGISAVVVYVISGDRILEWATILSEKFGEIGFSTRIFDFIIKDDFANDTGRDDLSQIVWDAIRRKPFIGYGFMGDRQFIGVYVHNIVLEFLCSYGFVLGGLGMAAVLYVVIASIVKNWGQSVAWFLLVFACFVLIKLMLSGSYVYEPYFYVLLGLSVGGVRRAGRS